MVKILIPVGETLDGDFSASLLQVHLTNDYSNDIHCILQTARKQAARSINSLMVEAYWLVGERIVEWEQNGQKRAQYGQSILQQLSKSLTAQMGDGFSYANLRNMRQFYLTYPNFSECNRLCSKLSWSHNRLIMRVPSAPARLFYLKEAAQHQWSVRELDRNIATNYYQRLLSTQIPVTGAPKPNDIRSFIKDPYVMEFLQLPKFAEISEKKLEDLLIKNLEAFLLELGKGFSFVGRQYRISTETTHYYIDLVFYNYILKCFVLIDLKAAKLTHQDIGQMDMYRRMFDDLKKGKDDNPTIGILLCANKDETVVKYSVVNDSDTLFASKYLPYLPTEEELKSELESGYRQLMDSRDSD